MKVYECEPLIPEPSTDDEVIRLLETLFSEGWSVNGINKGDGERPTYQVRISKMLKSAVWRPGSYTIQNAKGNGNSLLEALNAATDASGLWDELNDGDRES